MRLRPLVLTTLFSLCLALPSMSDEGPLIVWNVSPSVPVGVYWIAKAQPRRGSIAIIRLPAYYRRLAHQRGYLPASVLLMKPIRALPGDVLCRRGAVVTVNNRPVALALALDAAARYLPNWGGCRTLGAMQIAVIASKPNSFDSRYFGPIHEQNLVGIAVPLWTTAAVQDHLR